MYCPWHGSRDLERDVETGKVMQVCLEALKGNPMHARLEKKVKAFLKGCTLPIVRVFDVDVEEQLITWLRGFPTFKSKSEQVMRQNVQ